MRKVSTLAMLCLISISTLIAQTPILSDPEVEKIAGGFNFIEGPVWVEDLGLLFSDIPENKVYLFDLDSVVSEYYTPSGKSNGLALLNDTLILCQHFDRQVGKFTGDSIVPIATHYDGKRLNSPNDLTIKSNGTIFFTDPDFGLNDEGGTSDLGYQGIYSLTSDGRIHLLDNSLELPNGIVFSPDESKLYVVNSQVADIYVWDVVNDSTIENKTLFYNMNTQWGDGMKMDSLGFLYITAANGLTIFSPEGELIENIAISNTAGSSNCNWGSVNNATEMYITAGNSLYRLRNKAAETGINTNQGGLQNPINIYPNPSKGENITIKVEQFDISNTIVNIFDTSGKKVDSIKPNNASLCQWKTATQGVYIVKIRMNDRVYSKEFVVSE